MADKDHTAAGPYSQAIKTPSAVYCSGQIPCDKKGNLITGSIQELTAACIQNLKAVLEEAGSGIEKVVKVNVFLTDMANFAVCYTQSLWRQAMEGSEVLTDIGVLQDMNEEYAKWFTHKPARSCVAVKQLPKGVDVEIECIAVP